MWREFLGPRYREMTALAGARGVPVVSVDTDGDPEAIIPPMMEAGVNMLFPVEVAAGCDINAHVERYPEMGFMGGIDKRALAQGPAAIDAELERVRPAIQRGRYIADLDHLIPDDVSWRNWRYYAQALKELVCGT
jgi:uroporphyrinogen decarboxylase